MDDASRSTWLYTVTHTLAARTPNQKYTSAVVDLNICAQLKEIAMFSWFKYVRLFRSFFGFTATIIYIIARIIHTNCVRPYICMLYYGYIYM